MSQFAPQDQRPVAPPPLRLSLPAQVPYAAYGIVALTSLIYLLQLGSVALFGYANAAAQLDWLEAYGARINDLIRAGELWRFLTPVLLHASVPHILFNMYALMIFGPNLERHFGHARFITLYVLAGFTGNVLSFVLSNGYSVGASTAIFGLVGAEGIFLIQNRGLFGSQFGRAIGNVIFIVAVNLMLGLTPGIDNWGHVGGLLGGLIFTWFAGPVLVVQPAVPMGYVQDPTQGALPALRLADQREPREVLTGAAVVVLIFGALAVAGFLGL